MQLNYNRQSFVGRVLSCSFT